MIKLSALLSLFLFSITVNGQSYRLDSSIFASAYAHAVDQFHQFRGSQSDIYNGVQFIGYSKSIRGYPFWETENWEKGSVWYDGVLYPDITLRYDLVKDQVVVQHPGDMNMILLFSPRINYFTLGDRTFVYIGQKDSTSLSAGFYQLLYKGEISVYAKRIKVIYETIVDMHLDQSFSESNKYYIEKAGVYYPVRNAGTVMNLVKDHKKEIQQFLRRNKLKFKKNPELTLIKIADYYQQLSKQE